MQTKYTLGATVLSCLALTACGGSAPGTTSPGVVTISEEEESNRRFAIADNGNFQDAGELIENDETLTARNVARVRSELDYSNDTTQLLAVSDDNGFALRRNDSGELTMIVDGTEYAFTPGQRRVEVGGEVYGYQVEDDDNDIFYSLFNYTGEIDDIKTPGQGYAEVFGYQTNQVTDDGGYNIAGFSVVGAETRDSDLAAIPTATYSGRGRLNVRPQTGFESNGESRTRVRGDLNMTANFGAGTISGRLENLTVQDPGADRVDQIGAILLNESQFDVNGFAGTVSVDQALSDDGVNLTRGGYSGAFYGPVAEEVGGVIFGEYVDDGVTNNADGYFHGEKVSDD